MSYIWSVSSAGARFAVRLLLVTMAGTTLVVGQKKGSILVLADSGSTVYVNGQYQGVIQSAQDGIEVSDLRPGVHGVVLRKFGAESEEFKVDVKPGRQAVLEKRSFATLPVPEVSARATTSREVASRKDTAGGILGSERFVGLWREQRTGTFGNAHFEISLQGGQFVVRRVGESYSSDVLAATNMVDRGKGRSYGVVKLEGKVRHFGGVISMTLVVNAVVRDPEKDLNSESLAVQYSDVVGGGSKFEGSPSGLWVRLKR